MIELKNKKILLLGLGLHGGGVATACWLHKQGAKLIVSDLKSAAILKPSLAKLKCCQGIKFVLGQHREQDVAWADIVVQNPGVPKESPYIKLAKKLGKPVLNEASLFFDRCQAKITGITGTRGKSTTTALIGALLKTRDKRTLVAGNIRTTAMLDVVDKLKSGSSVVLELSSWQLEGLEAAKRAPSVAVITNLYPDHLNRY
ncbi:MAG: Mur ligase family protein, partial [Candidatus Komeilibacteria bacterium]|nr:Mur ligase family protein [Candidatus Komeilibacteria bacterium]